LRNQGGPHFQWLEFAEQHVGTEAVDSQVFSRARADT
jgi:hypothetical protein